MNLNSTYSTLLFSIILSGCGSPALTQYSGTQSGITPMYNLNSQFDADIAKKQLERGENTIKGSAFMRQNGGNVVTCAGQTVVLIPATGYAKERMRAIYKNEIQGSADFGPHYRFIPDHPEFSNLKKTTRCDAQGNFSFERISDGEFYLVTMVDWQVAGRRQGGNMMQHVVVKGGEVASVVIAP